MFKPPKLNCQWQHQNSQIMNSSNICNILHKRTSLGRDWISPKVLQSSLKLTAPLFSISTLQNIGQLLNQKQPKSPHKRPANPSFLSYKTIVLATGVIRDGIKKWTKKPLQIKKKKCLFEVLMVWINLTFDWDVSPKYFTLGIFILGQMYKTTGLTYLSSQGHWYLHYKNNFPKATLLYF